MSFLGIYDKTEDGRYEHHAGILGAKFSAVLTPIAVGAYSYAVADADESRSRIGKSKSPSSQSILGQIIGYFVNTEDDGSYHYDDTGGQRALDKARNNPDLAPLVSRYDSAVAEEAARRPFLPKGFWGRFSRNLISTGSIVTFFVIGFSSIWAIRELRDARDRK